MDESGAPDGTDAYERFRPLLFSIAYRMVGSVSEAEDIVQEAFLRFHRALGEGTIIESPKAYLSAVTTRLAIDHLRSARVRREQYVGQWLPEPLLTDEETDAARHAETADSLSMAFPVMLETLSPVERAVFVLREVFAYGYDEIARIVGKTEDNSRQIAARARRHVEARRPRFEASRQQRDELARRFLAAIEEGDTDGLVSMLAADAVMLGDGGGKAPAVAQPVYGRDRIVRFLVGLGRQAKSLGLDTRLAQVNGQPGVVAYDPEGRLLNVMSIDIAEGRVQTVRAVLNPDKLRHLGPVGDLRRLFRDRFPRGTNAGGAPID